MSVGALCWDSLQQLQPQLGQEMRQTMVTTGDTRVPLCSVLLVERQVSQEACLPGLE